MKILFVCLGNICRSPLAEAIFNFKIEKMGKKHLFSADSCGLSNYHTNAAPDSRVLAIAEKHGIAINHRGRQIHTNDLAEFDYILVMDHYNYTTIRHLEGAYIHQEKFFLMRHFDPEKSGEEVPDPYYGGEADFQLVFDILNRSVEGFIAYLSQPRKNR